MHYLTCVWEIWWWKNKVHNICIPYIHEVLETCTNGLTSFTDKSILTYLSPRAAAEPQYFRDDLEQTQEVLIFITEALAKHQCADDVGHSSAQVERRVKWSSYRKKQFFLFF